MHIYAITFTIRGVRDYRVVRAANSVNAINWLRRQLKLDGIDLSGFLVVTCKLEKDASIYDRCK
jgi:hypothetical protein